MTPPSFSVVLCAYTEARWSHLSAAIASVEAQTLPAYEIILVIDHNKALLARARETWEHAGLVILENRGVRGLSDARNSGTAAAQGDVTAFLDDDAVAAPDWLAHLAASYLDPSILGVGGAALPLWPQRKPAWFPNEFLWVVGCSHTGTPQEAAPVRNFIGCNMSFRRHVLERVGTFRTEMGRVGTLPEGCEETELCIRIQQQLPGTLLYNPSARVSHRVSEERTTLRYFMRRCYAEGRSKARVARLVGAQDALATERDYTLKTLPEGVKRGVLAFSKRFLGRHRDSNPDSVGLASAAAILLGLGITSAGYFVGRLNATLRRAPLSERHSGEEVRATPGPTQVLELELSEPLPTLSRARTASGERYERAFLLVRLRGKPLGLLEVALGSGVSAQALATLIWAELGGAITAEFSSETQTEVRLSAAGVSPALPGRGANPTGAPDTPFVSVIIATHNRPQSLALCLDSLAALDYPHYEVIVVDNAPKDAATFELLQHHYPEVHYVRENTPGLATAHNRGLTEAQGSLLAFTDDDVRVDKNWLSALVAGFDAAEVGVEVGAEVGCVTGMITPAELETPAQVWLEQYGGFSKGFERRVFDLNRHRPRSPLYPYTAGVFGSGANMAFRREALLELGGFDPALGAGSRGVGGDDLAAFFDTVNLGYALVYQPEAIVHHHHRRDYAGLQRQAYGYGVGLTAFLTKTLLDKPKRLLHVLPLVPRAILYTLSPTSPKNVKKRGDYPKELNGLERRGMLVGPLAYLRSRWHSRHTRLTPNPVGDRTTDFTTGAHSVAHPVAQSSSRFRGSP